MDHDVMMFGNDGEVWEAALRLAWEAFVARTTPVGAVVVDDEGRILASGRGRRYESDAPAGQLAHTHIAHAEINALAQLSVDRHWEHACLLTTLEPCGMCHGAAIQSTLGGLWYAAPDPYGGTAWCDLTTPQSRRRPLAIRGPLKDERGAFATMLHLAFLLQKPSATHVVEEHDRAMPVFAAFARDAVEALATCRSSDDYSAARALADTAPLHEFYE